MLGLVGATCLCCLCAAWIQRGRKWFAPFLWFATTGLCVFLMYWHNATVNEFRENTIQTLVWTMATILSFCMGLCAKLDAEHSGVLLRRGQPIFMARYVWVTVLVIMLCLLGLIPETKNIKSFMLTFIPSKVFFWSRPVSGGFCLFGAVGFLSIFMLRQGGVHARRIFCQSRDAAMFGGLAFIGGEICGSLWSLYGWGSTWRWSSNFYGSAATFLLVMVGMHLPSKILGRRVPRSFLSGVIYFVAGSSVLLDKLG